MSENPTSAESNVNASDHTWLIDGCDTIPKLFLKKSVERGQRIAMRGKDFGIWQAFTWDDYRNKAFEIAHGLLSLGLQPGDVVSIQSEDCKEWVFADLGIMLSGGVVNGIYPTYQSAQVTHALTDSRCRFLFVEDEEQLDKYLDSEGELTGIEKVIVFDWKGLRSLKHDKAQEFGAVHIFLFGASDMGQPIILPSATKGIRKFGCAGGRPSSATKTLSRLRRNGRPRGSGPSKTQLYDFTHIIKHSVW